MSEDLSVISENLKTLEIRTLNTSEKIKDFNISNAVPGDIIGYSGNSWVPVKSDNINTTSVDNTNVNEKIYASFDINSQTGPSTSGLDKYVNNFENLAASPVEINTSVNTPIEPITFTSDGVYLIIVNVALVYYVTGGDVEIISKIIKKNNNVETTLSTISVVSLGDTSAGGALPSSNISNYDFRTYVLSGNNVIDANGNVIFTSVGTGSISFSTSDGVFTSNSPNQYIVKSAAPPSIPSGNFSIEFYTKFGINPSDYHYNFYYHNASTNSIITMYIRSNGRFYFETWHNSPSGAFNVRVMQFDPFNISGGGTWDSTNFNHFVVTYSGGGTEKFYINGSLISSSIFGGYWNNIDYDANEAFNDLYLGGGGIGSSDRDKLDETTKFHRMYDGVLTTDEIDTLYTNRDETKWLSVVPAPITVSSDPGFILPSSNLTNYDFRTYELSGTDVIDSDTQNVIFATVGTGTISFNSTDGVFTDHYPDKYLFKSGGEPPISSGTFSVEFYTKFGALPGYVHFLYSYTSTITNSAIQAYINSNGKLVFDLWHNQPSGTYTPRVVEFDPFNTSTSINAWDTTNFHHFVFTYAGPGTEQLYLDGSLLAPPVVLANYLINYDLDETFETLYISGGGGPFSWSHTDQSEETTKFHRMYDGVLTTDEIDTLYTNRDETVGPTETVSVVSPASATSFSSLITHHTVNKFTQGEKLSFKLHCIQDTGTLDSSEITNGTVTVQKLD